MALIQTSALIDNITGSVGSSNFYKSKYGQVLRRKANRKLSYTTAQARIQTLWSQAIAYAKTVSAADMNGVVNDFASSMTYTKNGHSYTLSPFQYLVTLNFFRLKVGLAAALPSGQPRGRLDIPLWSIGYYYVTDNEIRIKWTGVLPANIYAIGSCSYAQSGAASAKPQSFPVRRQVNPGTTAYIRFNPNPTTGTNNVWIYFRFIDVTGTWTPLIWTRATWDWTP